MPMGPTIRERATQRLLAIVTEACAQGGTYDAERVKRDFNSLLPINQLPHEILAEILLVWVSQWREHVSQEDLIFQGKGYHRWIAITHVCHLWREVALNFAQLWCDFAVTGVESTDVMLTRSKHAPLVVQLYHSDALQEPIQHVIDHIHRIRRLIFNARELGPYPYVVGNSAPLLRSLFYDMRGAGNEITSGAATPFDHIDMPALTVLDLQNSGVLWSSPLLKPTLTELVFEESRSRRFGPAHYNSRMPEVLRALKNMPMLTEVYLRDVLPLVRADDYLALPAPFPVPRLSTLLVAAFSASAAYLLEHIILPQEAHIIVHCADWEEHAIVPLFRALFAKTSSADAAAPSPRLSSVYLGDSMFGAWDFDPGLSVLSASSESGLDPAPLLTVTLTSARTPLNAFLQHLGRVAPLANITTLYFEPPYQFAVDHQHWAAAAAGMVNVRTLGVGRHGFAMLFSVWTDDAWDGPFDADGALVNMPPFQRLEALIIRCVWMRRRPHPWAYSSVLNRLEYTLGARDYAGYSLKRLAFVTCVNMMLEDIVMLRDREVADEVEWDGKQYLATKGARDFRRSDGGEEEDDATSDRVSFDAGSGSDCSDESDEDYDDDTDDDDDDHGDED